MSDGAYAVDEPILRKLGLRTENFGGNEWTDLGEVVLYPDEPSSPKVKVEVSVWPAQFWRFTVTERAEGPDLLITTGSGTFCAYWQTAIEVAKDMIKIEELP